MISAIRKHFYVAEIKHSVRNSIFTNQKVFEKQAFRLFHSVVLQKEQTQHGLNTRRTNTTIMGPFVATARGANEGQRGVKTLSKQ